MTELARRDHLWRLSLVADTTDAAIVITDANSRVVYSNDGFHRMFGWTLRELQDQKMLELLARQSPVELFERIRGDLRQGHPAEMEEVVTGKGGRRYWGKIICNPVMDAQGQWAHTVSVLLDITKTKIHEVLHHRALQAMSSDLPLMQVLEVVCEEVERLAPEVCASILQVDEQGLLHPLASPSLPFSYSSQLDGVPIGPGEVCTAASRLLVERSIKDEFVARVVEAGRKMQPRHPLEPGAPMGALVDETQTRRVLDYIARGQAEGAKLALGGKRIAPVEGGCYVEPTVFDEVRPEHTISREEIFGPVLAVIPFDDEAQALEIANDTEYGLAAGVWTANLARAHRVARGLRAGSVWVNYWDGGDMTAPFGGYKQSGNGRDKSLHAFDKYTEIKATWINLAD